MSPVRPSILQRERDRLLNAAARALERCQVADDPSGAADEAAAILSEVVTLDGQYVPERPGVDQHGPCPDPDGHLWVMGDKRCQVDGCTAIFRVPEPGGIAGGVLDGTYDTPERMSGSDDTRAGAREGEKRWDEPPWSEAELDHHRDWLNNHSQSARPDECPICKALVARDDPGVRIFTLEG